MKKKSLLLTAVATLGLTAATMAQNVPNYVPTNGLVGWWPFNGNANDESGNGNNGQSVNILYASDRFGNSNASANFPNGNTNSEILIGNQINLQQFSISVWIRPTGQRGYDFHTVLTKIDQTVPLAPQNNFDIQTYMPDISNKIYATLGGNNTWQTSDFGNNSVVQNQWNQIILTFDGITSRTYFNSVLINSLNIINYYNPVSTLSFGNRLNTQSIEEFNWWGDLDDIGIWNRALTQQEITDLYNGNICYQSITVTDTLLINMGITGFNPVTYNNTIKIFPNPTNDHITINYGNFASLNGYQIKIENSLGQQVFQTNITQQSDYLNLTTWGGNGLYFVRIIDPQQNTIDIKKIVLQ
jgi:hypothetical protein